MNIKTHNWICYDADCVLCVRWAERFRGLLESHGFQLLPLQSPAARAALRVPESELLREMRVITDGGLILGGADALVHLSQAICKPLFAVARIPGVKPILRGLYRFLAHHRSCADGACGIRRAKLFSVRNPADWLPLLLLPPAAAAIGTRFPAWIYMWTLAFSLFFGCKWLCFRKAIVNETKTTPGRKLAFFFGWIGMDAANFFAKPDRAQAPRLREWLFTAAKILFGAVLLWIVARRELALNALLAGWTGMLGLIFLFHFGLFHLLALAWRAYGIRVEPLMRAPLLSRSLGEFWGNRWNTAFNQLTTKFLFHPLRHAIGTRTATMLVFLASGLVHDLVISVPARGGYGLPTLYFLLQGAGVLFEHTKMARSCGLTRGFRGWLFTLIVTAGPAFWLFHPPFVHHVILPMLHTLGAT